ncbi:hypothetical protein [Burkholderia sp. BCC1999]|uniref:hypothetical protein n=1 Tax=Burkholderia sp. BCC1999 TaxID=2817448 RepID=UPI002AC32889|nr:hypothetical protein [Burkholderia sp. BCC1999]
MNSIDIETLVLAWGRKFIDFRVAKIQFFRPKEEKWDFLEVDAPMHRREYSNDGCSRDF